MRALLLTFMLTAPFAAATELYTGVFTDHFVPGVFNETNTIMLVKSDTGFMAGTMVNSFGVDSFLVGYDHDINQVFSVGAVLATGYEPENFYLDGYVDSLPVFPLPYISINAPINQRFALSFNLISGVVFNAGFRVYF